MSLGETSKSFVHLFKGGGVWGETPRPYRGAGGPGPRWGPFRTGLRCHFGRCWASATGRQHPRRQARPVATAFPYSKKGGTDVPLLGWHRGRGFCLWKGRAGCLRARSRGYRLRSRLPARSALNGAHRAPAPCAPSAAFLPPAAPVKAVELCSTPRKFFEKNLTKNFCSPTARTCAGCQHRRGRSRRPIARIVLRGHAPRT